MKAVSKDISIWLFTVYVVFLILILGGITFLLSACTKEVMVSPYNSRTDGKIAVNFLLGDIIHNGNEVVMRNYSDINPETVIIPLCDDLCLVATLEADLPVRTRATTSKLSDGTLLRIVAYEDKTTYQTHADYKVAGSILMSDNPLYVAEGDYKFVVYSYNSTTTLPVHHNYTITDIYPSIDLLWGCYPLNGSFHVTASSNNDITVTISHLLSLVTVQTTTDGLSHIVNIDAISDVYITPGKQVNLSIKDGTLAAGSDARQNVTAWSGLGTTTVTSEPCMVYTDNAGAFHVKINSLTLEGYAAPFSNLTATFYKQLQSGVSYTVKVNFKEPSKPVPNVPVTGGTSAGFIIPIPPALTGKPSITWTASVVTLSGKTPLSDGGRTLVRHEAVLVNANGITLTTPGLYPLTTAGSYPISDAVYVRFPKIYWPNRHIPDIKARVTVTISAAGQSYLHVFDVGQDALENRGFHVGAVASAAYSGYESIYMEYFTGHGTTGANSPVSIRKISDFSLVNNNYDNSSAIASNVTYLHYASSNYSNNAVWTSAINFMAQEGLTLFVCDQHSDGHINYLNSNTSPMSVAGYHFVSGGARHGILDLTRPAITDTRVGQFLTHYGPTWINANISTLNGDDTDHTTATQWPAGAVPLSQENNNAVLIIDPVRKMIYCGEGEMFKTNTNQIFIRNLQHYVANAARYGSHFQDLFIDDNHPDSAGLPPIWDAAYWGANAWVIPVGMP